MPPAPVPPPTSHTRTASSERGQTEKCFLTNTYDMENGNNAWHVGRPPISPLWLWLWLNETMHRERERGINKTEALSTGSFYNTSRCIACWGHQKYLRGKGKAKTFSFSPRLFLLFGFPFSLHFLGTKGSYGNMGVLAVKQGNHISSQLPFKWKPERPTAT